ncbi:MAG: alpha/beta fold hydrolase [Gemmatimonadota bacterium]
MEARPQRYRKESLMRHLSRAAAAMLLLVPAAGAQSLPDGLVERNLTIPGPVPLPAVLTLPAGKGPFRAVLIVHGSGAGDRDLTVGSLKPYRDIAWGLAQQGVAVLRFDKRAKVAPMWYAGKAFTVWDETVQDAASALALLRAQPGIDARHVVMIGHSLGGMLAPRIATADGKLAGIVLLAGATRALLADQVERQFAYIASISAGDSATLAAVRTQQLLMAPRVARIRALVPADSTDLTIIMGAPAKYFLDLNAFDPAVAMRAIPLPLLILQGLRDYQVTPEQLDDYLRTLGPRPDVTVGRYESLNHLFLPGVGVPSPSDYAVPGHVDPSVIADIAVWIKRLP